MENESETKTVNWMLEGFPDAIKQKCKEKAMSQRKTLKAFVIDALREAARPPVLDSAHESGKEEIRHGSEQTDRNATGKTIRRKAGPKT